MYCVYFLPGFSLDTHNAELFIFNSCSERLFCSAHPRVHNTRSVRRGENALLSCSTSWYYGGLFGVLFIGDGNWKCDTKQTPMFQ